MLTKLRKTKNTLESSVDRASRYSVRAAAKRSAAESLIGPPDDFSFTPATLTIEQLAAYLQVSRDTGYALSRIPGKLPMLKAGRRRLIVRELLDQMMRDGTLKWTEAELRRSATPRRRAVGSRSGAK